jgi:uncharacterized protein YecE (DUF72 family)
MGLKTPPGLVFSLKIPQTITHQKILVDCDKEFEEFVSAAQMLGEKLGPMVFQFPFFNDSVFSSPVKFVSRLQAFFKRLPPASGCRFGVEIRNKYWLKPRLLDLLRQNNIALVLQDQSWMPHPKDLENYDLITADFSYIRWLGNRKDIEKLTTTWNATIIDRTTDLQTWVDVCGEIQKRGVTQYVYANNHYSGFAPATVELFRSLCKARGIETPLNVQLPVETEPTQFDISPN